jgi:hypothetical protein
MEGISVKSMNQILNEAHHTAHACCTRTSIVWYCRSYEEEQAGLSNMLLHSESSSCVPVAVLPLRRCTTLPDARGVVGSNNTSLTEDEVMAQQQLTSCTPALRRRRERECKYVTDQSQLNLRFHRPAHRHRQRPVSASASTEIRLQQSIRHRSVSSFL